MVRRERGKEKDREGWWEEETEDRVFGEPEEVIS